MAKKKKRLNKKMIIILASIGVIVLAAGFGWWLYRQPEDPHVYASRGAELMKKGEYKSAVRHYYTAARNAESDDPKKPEYYLSQAKALLEWNKEKGKEIGEELWGQNHHRALEALRKAMRLKPDFLEAQRLLTRLEFEGAWRRDPRDYKGCIAAADKLLAMDDKDHEILHQRALAYVGLVKDDPGALKLATDDFRTLVELAPCQEHYWLGLVNVCAASRDADRLEQMEKIYKEAIAANEKSSSLRIHYAQFLFVQDLKPEGVQVLNDIVKACPDEAVGYLSLASHYRREQDIDQAVANLKKAIEVEPASYRGYLQLAQIYTMRKEPVEVESVLKKGIDAIRESKKEEMSAVELNNYNIGIVLLDHQLCDILLNGLATSDNKEKSIQMVRDMLNEMQDVRDDNSDKGWFYNPHVAKFEGRLALVDGNPAKAVELLRKAYDSFRKTDRSPYLDIRTANLLIALYRQRGEPGESQQIVARIVKISGGSQSSLTAMVTLYIDSRQYEQAQRLLGKINRTEALDSIRVALEAVMGRGKRIPPEVVKLDPVALRLFFLRAQQLWLQGEQESAIGLLSDIMSREPKNLNVMVQIIMWHKARKELDQAKSMLAHAREIYKDDPKVLEQLSLLMETDPKKILAHLLKQASSDPDPVRKALRIADIYRSFGNEEKFLEYLSVAEKEDPQNAAVISQRFEYSIGKEDWESAEKYADAAAANNIDTVDGNMFRARLAAKREKLDDAIGFAQDAVVIRPHFSRAHSLMGDCYLAKGQIEQAREQYELAYDKNPSNVSALTGMMNVSRAVGNTADYAKWVERAYKFAPQDTQVREAYLRLRSDPDEAIKGREQVRKSQPKNMTNLSYLAMLYERAGRMSDAEEIFREMVTISNGNPMTVGAFAEFLRRRKRDVEARDMLADYATKATDKVAAYLIWAGYMDASGETEQAKAIYKKALAADPKDARVYLGTAYFEAQHGNWISAAENQRKYIEISGEKTRLQERKKLIAYLINAKELDDAEKEIDQRLHENRTDLEMLTMKALIYIQRKDYTKAEKILDNTLKIRPDYVPALIRRADVHLATGKKDLAVADLESARLADAAPMVSVQLAAIYESMNRVDSAIGILQGLLSDHPQSNIVLKSLAGLYGRRQQWSSLERILDAGKKAHPDDTFYLRKEAEMWLQRKVPSRAVSALDKAVQLAPDDVTLSFFRMVAMVEDGQFDKAIDDGKKLRSGNEDIAPSVMSVTALALEKSKRHAAADAEFAAAMKASKSNRQIAFVLRYIRKAYSLDQIPEKLKLLLKVKPNDPQIYQMMGEVLMIDEKDLKLSVECFSNALRNAEADPHKVLIMGKLGLVYSMLGQHEDSQKMYKKALEINADNAQVLNNLAWLLAHDMNKPDQALPYIQKSRKLAPEAGEFLDTHGYVLMQIGKYDEALDLLSRSVDKRSMPSNRLHLGEVYEKMGRRSDAMRQYRTGWELVKDKPKNKYYRKLREAIERLGDTPGGSTE